VRRVFTHVHFSISPDHRAEIVLEKEL